MTPVHRTAVAGFSRATEAYERGRPGYPPEIVASLAERLDLRAGRIVVDVGAGTGKLTRALVPTGARVIAVEPVRAMRETLARESPRTEVLDGTAESLPLDRASVDAVVSGQAFHWFDGERALREFHRVLRPDGGLALVWNRRCLEQPIQAAISEIVEPYRSNAPAHEDARWREPFERLALFGAVGEERVPFEQELDAGELVARVASTSFVAALGRAERVAVLGRVRALVPEEAARVRLRYVSHAFLYRRR